MSRGAGYVPLVTPRGEVYRDHPYRIVEKADLLGRMWYEVQRFRGFKWFFFWTTLHTSRSVAGAKKKLRRIRRAEREQKQAA